MANQAITPDVLRQWIDADGPTEAAKAINLALMELQVAALAKGIEHAGIGIVPDPPDIEKTINTDPNAAARHWAKIADAIVGIERISGDWEMPNGPPAKVEAVALDRANMKPVTWLWPGRIPRGKITMLDGDPGLGKSTLAFDLAARVSTGRPMPMAAARSGPPDSVLILSFEDDADDTITPRIVAADGDETRVFILKLASDRTGADDRLDLGCIADFEQIIRDKGAVLLIIDPLSAAFKGKTDAHREADVRRDLGPLADMANRTGCAVLAVRHLKKSGSDNALHAGIGSIGIVAAARSALAVKKHPENEDKRLLLHVKANLSELAETIEYEVSVREAAPGIDTSAIEWVGHSDLTADDVMTDGGPKASKVDECAEWLLQIMADSEFGSTELERMAGEHEFSAATLRRAKKTAGVKSRKLSLPGGRSQWMCSIEPAIPTNGAGAHG